MSAPPRRIKQATFDAAVDENVREFGMTREEAVADAIAQFQAANVDLSSVITSVDAPSHPVLRAIADIRARIIGGATPAAATAVSEVPADAAVAAPPAADDDAALSAALTALAQECTQSATRAATDAARNREIAGNNDGVELVRAAMKRAHGPTPKHILSPNAFRTSVDALRAVCAGTDVNRAAVPEHELEAVVDGLAEHAPAEPQRSCLLLCATLCIKREPVKTYLYDLGVPAIIMRNLDDSHSDDAGIVKDTCTLMNKILTDDDYTVFSSKAYEYARVMASQGVAARLLKVLQKHNHTLATAAEVFSAIRSICVNDEICREIESLDGVEVITAALADYVTLGDRGAAAPADGAATPAALTPVVTSDVAGAQDTARRVRMVRNGFAVLRSLGHSDPIKLRMCEGAAAPLGIMLLALQSFTASPSVLEQSIASIAILCLRLPQNAQIVQERDGLNLIAACMRAHPGHAGTQRSACLAIRNIVVRSPPRIAAAIDAGLEHLLQQAYMSHVIARDVSYACLRDMGFAYAETDIGKAQAERAARAIQTGDIRTQ